MSKYTTGEIAKICGVSVRTVQYYDFRNILVPSELSEGGRRLYSEEDLKKMKIICFLREAGLPINSISQLFCEDDPGSVISILLEQQEQVLNAQLNDCRTKLDMLEDIKRGLKNVDDFSVESIGDIANIMENKKKLRKVHTVMLLSGLPLGLMQWTAIVLWIVTGIWWPFAVWALIAVPWAILISAYYLKRVAYICPKCHEVFKPKFKEAFFAPHTPTTRKLTCTKCNHRGYCVETYGK